MSSGQDDLSTETLVALSQYAFNFRLLDIREELIKYLLLWVLKSSPESSVNSHFLGELSGEGRSPKPLS